MTIEQENEMLKKENEALKAMCKEQVADLKIVKQQVFNILLKFGFVDEAGNSKKPNKIKLMGSVKDMLFDSMDGEGNGFLDKLIKALSPVYNKYQNL